MHLLQPIQAPVVSLYKTNYKLYLEHCELYRKAVEALRSVSAAAQTETHKKKKEAKAAKAEAAKKIAADKPKPEPTTAQIEGKKAHKRFLRKQKRARRKLRDLGAQAKLLEATNVVLEKTRKNGITHFGTLEVAHNTDMFRRTQGARASATLDKSTTVARKAASAAKAAKEAPPPVVKGPTPRKPKTASEKANAEEGLPLNHPRRSGKPLDQEILCYRPIEGPELFFTGIADAGLTFVDGTTMKTPPTNLVSNLPKARNQNQVRLFACGFTMGRFGPERTTTELLNWLHYYETDPNLTLVEKELVKRIRTVVETRRSNYGRDNDDKRERLVQKAP